MPFGQPWHCLCSERKGSLSLDHPNYTSPDAIKLIRDNTGKWTVSVRGLRFSADFPRREIVLSRGGPPWEDHFTSEGMALVRNTRPAELWHLLLKLMPLFIEWKKTLTLPSWTISVWKSCRKEEYHNIMIKAWSMNITINTQMMSIMISTYIYIYIYKGGVSCYHDKCVKYEYHIMINTQRTSILRT